MTNKLLCNDCKGTPDATPDYKDNEKVDITLIGLCTKCGCGIYTVKPK